MVDSIQKYYEDVNDMLVKELPALVDSIQSEIGANESQAYEQQAGETLTALNAALQEAKTAMTAALGGLTGQGDGFDGADMGDDMGADMGDDMGADMGDDMGADMGDDMGADMGDEDELPPIPDMPDEGPEMGAGPVGRAKR